MDEAGSHGTSVTDAGAAAKGAGVSNLTGMGRMGDVGGDVSC